MNLVLDVEKINDISFNGKIGVINLDIPNYEINDFIENISVNDIFNYVDDEDLIDELERRGYKVEK